MTSTRDLVQRIRGACESGSSAKALRERVLGLVREQVAFDGHVFALTDPVTRVATAPHADVPMLPWPRLPELIRWRYLTLVNRPDRMLGQPAASLLGATDSPHESLMWHHVQSQIGVTDTAMVAFGDRYGAWGFLELWRTGGAFVRSELDLLTAIAGPVSTGLRRAVAQTFVASGERELPQGAAVIVLGPDLVVHSQTEGAAAAWLRLLPPEEEMAPIPAAAYNIAAALIACEHGVPVGEPWARVHLGTNLWATVKASRLGDDIAVSVEPSTPFERLGLFGRAMGLSARESEVLALLGVGLDSREIAGQLFLSEHTVNDHVKAILAKAGTRTRQVLLARALGSA